MNRLASPQEDTLTLDSTYLHHFRDSTTELPTVPGETHDRGQIATFAPVHYESGYAYPLLIWLHGRGGNERQLARLMPLISLRNHVAVAPRGTQACPDSPRGFTWCHSASGIAGAEKLLFDCLDEARERFHIHPGRVFVAGCDTGGTMAVRLAWKHPERFAGAATFGGPLPSGHRPLTRINELRKLPLLISAGCQALEYSQQRVCADLRLLHSAGFTAALRQYPCGDELRTVMLTDLDRWMIEIVCAQSFSTAAH